jgi:pimeloyl-ACP methyl ester carboxylesterase
MTTPTSQVPDWFQFALDAPSMRRDTTVDGCRINYVVWGNPDKPGLVLLHGSNAFLEWWRPIAPLLADQFHVVALDSSGSGNSGWRDEYSGAQFAREVMAVATAAGITRPYVAGHSFGGFVALETGHLYGADLGGIILLDFTIHPPARADEFAELRRQRHSQPVRPTRVYPDKAAALARFRLVPEQVCKNDFIINYLAEHALRQVEGGWTWKFDPGMFRNLVMDTEGSLSRTDALLGLKCPSAFIMAEHSLDYSPQSRTYTEKLTDGVIPAMTIPCTRHHLMFDEPLAVAMAMKGLLLAWEL